MRCRDSWLRLSCPAFEFKHLVRNIAAMKVSFVDYGALALAIICEVTATGFLQKSEQFTRLVPTLVMGAFYVSSLFFLSQALRTVPLGIAYAIWAGLGIILTAVVSSVVFHQTLDRPAMVGIGMIVTGVVIASVLSKSVAH